MAIDVKAIREFVQSIQKQMEEDRYVLESRDFRELIRHSRALLAEVDRRADAIRILDRICEGQLDTIKALEAERQGKEGLS